MEAKAPLVRIRGGFVSRDLPFVGVAWGLRVSAAPRGERGGMVTVEQLHKWRMQLADDPSSFSRDLAAMLLKEFERMQRDAGEGYRRAQANLIRAQLATRPPKCTACGDAAALQVAEQLRGGGITREPRSTLACW
jgi:hypothetical protein